MTCQKGWRRDRRQASGILAVFGALAALSISACGGGSGSGSGMNQGAAGPNGMPMITLTDDPGDFLSYVVNVRSLQLTRADGTVVETVPTTTQVDFAQLVNLAEIVSTEQVPAGNYVTVTLTLDYTAANIVVDNGTMSGLTVTNILNAAGTPLSSPVQMTLQLPADRPLVITPGTVANLALDFNLAASNALVTYPAPLNPVVDTSPATPPAVYIGSITESSAIAVEVSPTLAASLTPDTSRQIRVRGPLATVDTSNDSYTIDVRPFWNSTGSQGTFTVNTSGSTTFAINGTAYSTQTAGIAALDALAGMTPPALTLAYGTFDVASGAFTASQVFAGSSVPGAGLDSIEGTVIARTNTSGGATLTVTRARLWPRGGGRLDHGFKHTISVLVGSATMVTEDAQTGSFAFADISVGQHLQVFGKYTGSSDDDSQGGGSSGGNSWGWGSESGMGTLDATVAGGYARLMVTPTLGMYSSSAGNGSAGSVVTMSLQALDNLPAMAFNFAGTGVSGQDATASAYTVGVPPAIPIPSALGMGAPIAFRGFVTPFGTANGASTPIVPDFAALTLVNYAGTDAQLLLGWMPPGVMNPFAGLASSSTTLTMSQSTLESVVWYRFHLGPESIAAASLTSGLTLTADSSATMTQFGIVHLASHMVDTFSSFGALVSALYGDLNPAMGTAPTVLGLFATGPYDFSSSGLSVDRAFIALSD
jgi:Domain of unknown function (DUF4382)